MAWLGEVPEPHRSELDRRLKSKLDHAHFSARLELFVHHYFVSNSWPVQIHPNLPNTNNHPDFLVQSGQNEVIVECTTILDRRAKAQQDQRLAQLAEEIGNRINVAVVLEPLSDLPSSLPAGRISDEIIGRIDQDSDIQEIDIRGSHQNSPYDIRAIIFGSTSETDLSAGVHGLIEPAKSAPMSVSGLMSQAHYVTVGQQLLDALRKKGWQIR